MKKATWKKLFTRSKSKSATRASKRGNQQTVTCSACAGQTLINPETLCPSHREGLNKNKEQPNKGAATPVDGKAAESDVKNIETGQPNIPDDIPNAIPLERASTNEEFMTEELENHNVFDDNADKATRKSQSDLVEKHVGTSTPVNESFQLKEQMHKDKLESVDSVQSKLKSDNLKNSTESKSSDNNNEFMSEEVPSGIVLSTMDENNSEPRITSSKSSNVNVQKNVASEISQDKDHVSSQTSHISSDVVDNAHNSLNENADSRGQYVSAEGFDETSEAQYADIAASNTRRSAIDIRPSEVIIESQMSVDTRMKTSKSPDSSSADVSENAVESQHSNAPRETKSTENSAQSAESETIGANNVTEKVDRAHNPPFGNTDWPANAIFGNIPLPVQENEWPPQPLFFGPAFFPQGAQFNSTSQNLDNNSPNNTETIRIFGIVRDYYEKDDSVRPECTVTEITDSEPKTQDQSVDGQSPPSLEGDDQDDV